MHHYPSQFVKKLASITRRHHPQTRKLFYGMQKWEEQTSRRFCGHIMRRAMSRPEPLKAQAMESINMYLTWQFTRLPEQHPNPPKATHTRANGCNISGYRRDSDKPMATSKPHCKLEWGQVMMAEYLDKRWPVLASDPSPDGHRLIVSMWWAGDPTDEGGDKDPEWYATSQGLATVSGYPRIIGPWRTQNHDN